MLYVGRVAICHSARGHPARGVRHPAREVRWGGRPLRVCFRPIFAGYWISALNKNLLDYSSIRLYTVLYPRWWNEWGFRTPLCTYRFNWARRTSWGWWGERDDTGFEIRTLAVWCRARYLSVPVPTILNIYDWAGKTHLVSSKLEC